MQETTYPAGGGSGRRGSMILAAVGTLGVLFLAYFVFMRALSGISHQSNILCQKNISQNFANDSARLACFFLQKKLADRDDHLVKLLTGDLRSMVLSRKSMLFTGPYRDLMNDLLTPLRDSMDIDLEEIIVEVDPLDFKAPFGTIAGKQLEKTGFIRMKVSIKVNRKVNNFYFQLPVTVAMPIPQTLKRFVLYVQDPVPPSERSSSEQVLHGYNQLYQDQYGNLMPGKSTTFRPLSIRGWTYSQQDLINFSNDPARFQEHLLSRAGMIFLGGNKKLMMNLGAGEYEAGESRHLFVEHPSFPRAKNLYQVNALSSTNYYIRFRDAGFEFSEMVARQAGEDESKLWLPAYEMGLRDPIQDDLKSTVLKLYGLMDTPTACFSPALVVGPVYRRFLRCSLYKHKEYNSHPAKGLPDTIGGFIFPPSKDIYKLWLTGAEIPGGIATVARELNILPNDIDKYLSSYSSGPVVEPYNRSIDFIATLGHDAAPADVVPSNCQVKKDPGPKPAYYLPDADFSPGSKRLNLEKILEFDQSENFFARRSNWHLDLDGEGNGELKARGILYGTAIDPRGVVYISRGSLKLKAESGAGPLVVKSTGSLVTLNGNITIQSGITRDPNSEAILAIAALGAGNRIVIETDQPIHALLICPRGSIEIKTQHPLSIVGGLACDQLNPQQIDFNKMFGNGGSIVYDPSFSLPLDEEGARKQLAISTPISPEQSFQVRSSP